MKKLGKNTYIKLHSFEELKEIREMIHKNVNNSGEGDTRNIDNDHIQGGIAA